MTDIIARTADSLVDDEAAPDVVSAITLLAQKLGVDVKVNGESVQAHADAVAENEKLRKLITDMQEDWRTLNRFLNGTAVHYSWCGTWEDRIRQYNNRFRVMRLAGRVNRPAYGVGAFDPYGLGNAGLDH